MYGLTINKTYTQHCDDSTTAATMRAAALHSTPHSLSRLVSCLRVSSVVFTAVLCGTHVITEA